MKKNDLSPAVSPRDIANARLSDIELGKIHALTVESIKAARERVGLARETLAPAAAQVAAGASAPPLSNTGGKSELPDTEKFICVNGKMKAVPNRKGWDGGTAFIDWVNFVVHESTFDRPETFKEFLDLVPDAPVTDDELVLVISRVCEQIFGFGITHVRPTGANFYKRSYNMEGKEGQNYGMVCHGGQRNTVLITIRGEGCQAAREGWEYRLKQFLGKSHDGRITRVDLAHDDFTGEVLSVDGLSEAYEQGGFNCGGRNPDIEQRGNWRSPNGKGRTLYVGNRGNGKFFRGYEKGKQLGDSLSPWVRAEVELKAVDRFIPFDVLLHPGKYLAASYPVLNFISERQERILTTQKVVQASYERTKAWLKHQCGAAIHLMHQIEGNAESVLSQIMREGKKPRGMVIPYYEDALNPIHNQHRESLPLDAVLSLSFSN